MLSKSEIERLLKKKEPIVADMEMVAEARSWGLDDFNVSAELIGTAYTYMKTKYKPNETLEDMELNLGIAMESISRALKALEAHGYLTISRALKPYQYLVIK